MREGGRRNGKLLRGPRLGFERLGGAIGVHVAERHHSDLLARDGLEVGEAAAAGADERDIELVAGRAARSQRSVRKSEPHTGECRAPQYLATSHLPALHAVLLTSGLALAE